MASKHRLVVLDYHYQIKCMLNVDMSLWELYICVCVFVFLKLIFFYLELLGGKVLPSTSLTNKY